MADEREDFRVNKVFFKIAELTKNNPWFNIDQMRVRSCQSTEKYTLLIIIIIILTHVSGDMIMTQLLEKYRQHHSFLSAKAAKALCSCSW